MPTQTGQLIDVITPAEQQARDQQPRRAQPASILPPLSTTAQTPVDVDRQIFHETLQGLGQFDAAIQRDNRQLAEVNREVNAEFDKLNKHRWIDDILGPEVRELIGYFNPNFNDKQIARNLQRLDTRQNILTSGIKAKQEARKHTFDLTKQTIDIRHKLNQESREAAKFGTDQIKSFIQNASMEDLTRLRNDERFSGFRGLINRQLVFQAEHLVKGLSVQELTEIVNSDEQTPLRPLAIDRLRELDSEAIANEKGRIGLLREKLGLTADQFELEKLKGEIAKTETEANDAIRRTVLRDSSIITLRESLNNVDAQGMVNVKGVQYPQSEVQKTVEDKLAQHNTYKEGEFQRALDATKVSSQMVSIVDGASGVQQADLILPVRLTNQIEQAKMLVQDKDILRHYPKQISDELEKLETSINEQIDTLIEKNYSKELQPAMREFITQREFTNPENASKLLIGSMSPRMGAREGSVFANSMRMLATYLNQNIEQSFFLPNGQVDLAKLAAGNKADLYQKLPGWIADPENGIQKQMYSDIALNYTMNAVRRFEQANPQVQEISGQKMVNGQPVFDTSLYMLNLKRLTGDNTLIQQFISHYNDPQQQERFVEGVKYNANPKEAAFIKLVMDNSMKNIIVRKGAEINSQQKMAIVDNRFQQERTQQLETETREAGWIRAGKDIVDRAVENGEDYKNIKRRIEHYFGKGVLEEIGPQLENYTEMQIAVKREEQALQNR